MNRLLLFLFATLAFAACTQNDVEELSTNRADVPETLTIGFEGDDTRIQLNSNQKTVWNENDNISVFYHSDANQKWQFQGETGERQGQFKRLQNAESTTKIANIVVAYPYSEDYFLNTQSYNIEAMLPAVQHYAEDSYGVGDNLMVSQSEFTQFTLKNVCGWLKIQLTGNGERVTHLMLRGNNEEQLAGLIYVDTDTAESTLVSEMGGFDDMENSIGGGLIPDDAIVTEITLNCGEGVELGAEANSFYIAVPPQTFEKGFTVEVECDNGTSITKSSSEPITIERNHIKPMEAIKYDGVLPEVYELAYRTNDGKALDPITTEGFGGEFKENIFDSATGEGKLVFAGAITTIPNQAFGFCENLTWIEIPLGVTSIGVSAFSGCSSMVELTIPASVTSVGSEAFVNCTGKAYINCSGVSFSGAEFAEVVIGDSVTTIGGYAFYDCSSLTSITIPDSVTTIGDYAFYECSSLTSVTIGDSVTTIGDFAFYDCSSLTSIAIPDSVTTIGDYAFGSCYSLTSITIPDSVTTIGDLAFCNCFRLTEFNGKFASEDGRCLIVEGLLNSFAIGCGATDYTIPDSVTTIGSYAFSWCYSLTNVTIPDSVTTIGDYAFLSCYSLKSVYCEATTPPSLGGNVFEENASDRLIYVPVESLDAYLNAEGWRDYADAIVGYDFETGEITKPSINLGVCGTFTNWGQDGILDIEMEYLADRNLYVAYGIELTTDDCFKLRSNNEWNGRYNIGASYYGYVAYPNCLTEVINGPGSQDIFVAESGTYDIYINLDTMELYFMVEGLDIFEEEEEFEPTHIANECMWGGYSSISWGNYYNVQGENFSLQLHFCTDVALESSIAAGKYDWVGIVFISNSNPKSFSTRSFTVNGNSVAVDSGKATVKVSGEEYTINLTLDGSDGNTYCIQYVGKLNVKYEAPNEGGDDDGDPNTITLNTFVYNLDLRGNYYGYLFEATAENVELGICISSKSCSPTHIDAGDYTYNQYPEDHAYAFQLRGSKINGTDVSQDPNATMNVAVNGGVYTITIVTNGYILTYNGTL